MPDEPVVVETPVENSSGEATTTETPTAPEWQSVNPEVLSKFSTETDLAKSYVELQKVMRSQYKIPEKEDTQAWEQLYDKLGRPQSKDEYQINPEASEGVPIDDNIMAVVKDAAHKAGLNPGQWDNVMGSYLGAIKASMKAQEEEVAAKNTELWKTMTAEWGETATAENMELAKRAVRESPHLKDVLSEEQIAKDPIFIAFVSDLMRKSMDDKLVQGNQSGEEDYKPDYPNDPEMYAYGESEDSKKARAWFERQGHKY